MYFMLIINAKKKLKSYLTTLDSHNTLGLVPTMGALHQGHISLIKKAFDENNQLIVSIFVNPTQFNNQDDLVKYPKTLDADIELLKTISDTIVVFAPTVEEMYGDNVKSKAYNFNGLDKVMEGAYREDHFEGVATIVEALLTLIKPDNAYFGEKDFQQLQIIKSIVSSQNIPVNIIGCPIIRESHGLAMSSRNERLSPIMRKEASLIYETLKSAKNKFGIESANKIVKWVKSVFEKSENLELEYFEISETDSLRPINNKNEQKKYRAFIAVYAEGVRLIDNIALN